MNHFNYFTEIEEHFSRRRGSLLMLSTLDWALIETWREAGVPLEAVLRGIDASFDKHEAQKLRAKGRLRKINGLAWAAQAVMQATEAAVDAATGLPVTPEAKESGFEEERLQAYLLRNAEAVEVADAVIAGRLRELAATAATASPEELDRTLTVLEEKLFAGLLAAAPEAEITALRAEADRELAPYRSRMGAVQLRQVAGQFLQKRLLEARGIPRLSLFYMPHD